MNIYLVCNILSISYARTVDIIYTHNRSYIQHLHVMHIGENAIDTNLHFSFIIGSRNGTTSLINPDMRQSQLSQKRKARKRTLLLNIAWKYQLAIFLVDYSCRLHNNLLQGYRIIRYLLNLLGTYFCTRNQCPQHHHSC